MKKLLELRKSVRSVRTALNTRSHLGAGRPQRCLAVRRARSTALSGGWLALASTTVLTLARGFEGPQRVGAKGLGQAGQAALIAAGTAEQVDRQAAAPR